MPSLDQWERSLRPHVLASSLIGEVDLAPADIEELGNFFRGVIDRLRGAPAFRRIVSHWPASYLVWLVATASEKYDGSNLWQPVCADLGVQYGSYWATQLGECFEDCYINLGFKTDFLGGGGYRFVTPILGHSGVPVSLLPGFFQDVIHANIAWSTLDGSPEEIIAAALDGRIGSTQPRAVQRFLAYGGDVARDFVAGCLQLARDMRAGKGVPDASELSVSSSVIDAYLDWLRTRGEQVSLSQSGRRFHTPRIILSPEQYIPVHLELPAEPLPATVGHLRHIWHVEIDGEEFNVPVDARRGDTGLDTRVASLPIPAPWTHLRAALIEEDSSGSQHILREWSYLPSVGQCPALIFDPDNQQLVPSQRSVPASELWFLLQNGTSLVAPSPDKDTAEALSEVEEFPTPGAGWIDWSCLAFDLSSHNQVVLKHGERSQQIWMDSLARLPLAAFEGARNILEDVAAPLFTDCIPFLRINMDGYFGSDLDLSAWTLTFLNLAENATTMQSYRLSEISQHVTQRDRGVSIDIASVLPVSTEGAIVGPVRLRVAGPRRCSAEVELRAVIGMAVSGLDDLYLPSPDADAVPVTLEVTLPSSILLAAPIPGEEHFVQKISSDSHCTIYRVEIPATANAVRLQVRSHDGAPTSTQLSFSLPISRLRWRLESNSIPGESNGEFSDDSTWQSHPLTFSAPELDQLDIPRLAVDFGTRGAAARALQLITKNRDGDVLSIMQPSGRMRHGEIRFTLQQMRDAYRSHSAGLCRACLVFPHVDTAATWAPNSQISETNADQQLLEVPCLYVTRDIQIHCANLEIDARPNSDLLRLTWAPAIDLRDLRLRIWSLTNPYLAPLALLLPTAERDFEYEVTTGAIPAGVYLLEFIVHDPWRSSQQTGRPSQSASNAAIVVIGNLAARADALLQNEGELLPVAHLLEAALLYQQAGDRDLASIALDEVERLPPDSSGVDLLNLIAEFEHEPSLTRLRIRLYQSKYMKPIVAERRAGNVSDDRWRIFRKYLYDHIHLSQDTLLTLLDVPDMGVQSRAMAALILEGNAAGLEHLQKLRRERIITLEDIASYLQLDDRVAARYLDSEESDGVRRQILSHVSPERRATIAGRLVHLGNPFGVTYLVDLLHAGHLAFEDALTHLEADAAFAAEVLESLGSDEALRLQSLLLEKSPEALPTISEGSEVQTRFGWATIYRIESSDGKRLSSLPYREAGDGVYSVRLLPVHGSMKAKLHAPKGTLDFEVKALFECKECNEFVSTRRPEVEIHIACSHGAKCATGVKKHTNTAFRQDQELRFRAPIVNAGRTKEA